MSNYRSNFIQPQSCKTKFLKKINWGCHWGHVLFFIMLTDYLFLIFYYSIMYRYQKYQQSFRQKYLILVLVE